MNANGAKALIYADSFMHQELVDVILNHAVALSVEGKEGFTTKNHVKKF
jgi:hypothetical protein